MAKQKRLKAWSFEPYEIWPVKTWEVYDENLARVVAVFTDKRDAQNYLAAVNYRQAVKKARQAVKKAKHAARQQAKAKQGKHHDGG